MQFTDPPEAIAFIIFYLVTIWVFLGILIAKNRGLSGLLRRDPVWKWTFLAYFLLGFGDIFHLGLRIIIFFGKFPPEAAFTHYALGIGSVLTDYTMTYFYVALTHAWIGMYGQRYSTLQASRRILTIAYVAYAFKLVLDLLPFNHWIYGNPTSDFGFDFRMVSALPIFVIGIQLMILLYRSTQAERKNPSPGLDPERNRGNLGALWSFVVSFACYLPVVLFVYYVPMTGMFMIPKTVAYLAAFYFHYRTMLAKPA
jgi:hypothetical protein